MITMYLCFLAGGAVLPFISVVLGNLGDGVDTDVSADVDVDVDVDVEVDVEVDVDIDADADLDVDTGANVDLGPEIGSMFSIGLFPTSLMAISALAITFGAVGGVMTLTQKGKIITFVVAVIAGYFASVAVQTIIKSLKKIQKSNYGLDKNELLLYDGKVVDTILPGQLGTVSFITLKGIGVSYPARCADKTLKLETGKVVKANEFKDGVVIVEPKNKYE